MAPRPAFVLGGGANGLGVARDLGSLGAEVTVFDRDPGNIAFSSRYVHRTEVTPADDPAATAACIGAAAAALPQRPVLIVCADHYLAVVDAHRQRILPHADARLASRETIATVLDKNRFGRMALATELPIARSILLPAAASASERATLAAGLRFPVIAKPERAEGWQSAVGDPALARTKAMTLTSPEALADLLARLGEVPVALQEYIDGRDDEHYSWFSCRDAEGYELLGFGIRKFRISPIRHGVAAFVGLSDDAELRDAGRAVLDHLGYPGVASVCFKRDRASGHLLCYEVNGRFPLAHSAGRLGGLSLARAYYADVTGTAQASMPARSCSPEARWMLLQRDLRAAVEYRRAGELGTGPWLRSLAAVRTVAEWDWRDPMPLVQTLRRAARRRGGGSDAG